MAKKAAAQKKNPEPHGNKFASRIRDFILGWQDGLVNVLGVILGVATATSSVPFVIIAALAAAFAESVSMAAVAYTSFKAEREYYYSEVAREKMEMEEMPDIETQEIHDIYSKLGFKGSLLKKIVKHITSNKERWLKVMMEQELNLHPSKVTPLNSAVVVGFSALFGSFIPAIPFFILPLKTAVWVAVVISTVSLFGVGFYKAKTTIGNPVKSGLEIAAIGILAALIGYGIGAVLGAIVVVH